MLPAQTDTRLAGSNGDPFFPNPRLARENQRGKAQPRGALETLDRGQLAGTPDQAGTHRRTFVNQRRAGITAGWSLGRCGPGRVRNARGRGANYGVIGAA